MQQSRRDDDGSDLGSVDGRSNWISKKVGRYNHLDLLRNRIRCEATRGIEHEGGCLGRGGGSGDYGISRFGTREKLSSGPVTIERRCQIGGWPHESAVQGTLGYCTEE